MRTVAPILSAIIMLAVACGDDSTGAPAPAPTDTPLPRADRSGKRNPESPGFRSHGYACNGSRSGGRTGSLTDSNSDAAAHPNRSSDSRADLDSHASSDAGSHGHANVLAHRY